MYHISVQKRKKTETTTRVPGTTLPIPRTAKLSECGNNH